MCFTVSINLTKEQIEKRFGAVFDPKANYKPGYYFSAFNLPFLPVISNKEPGVIKSFQWGLIPSWIKNDEKAKKIRYSTFNARAETITEKPSFKNPVKHKRCLIISDGFFEWHTANGKKIPYYIYLKEHKPFAFAGIYDTWKNPSKGFEITTFSIITTKANPMIEKIHNIKKRMPVILTPDEEKTWISQQAKETEIIKLLKPYVQHKMKAHTVSPLINKKNTEKNTPNIIEPYNYDKEQNELF